MKKLKILMLLLILGLAYFSSTNMTSAQIEEDIRWDYSGYIRQQTDRGIITEDSPFRLNYYYHLFYDEETEQIDSIVVIYGLRPIINAPHYSKFFDKGVTQTHFSYWLNKSVNLKWINVTYDMCFNEASPDYNPEFQYVYNATTSNAFVKNTKDIWQAGKLKYPIHFANLSSVQGEDLGEWKMIKSDGTIIRGQFTTYGTNYPLYNNSKTHYIWPYYNITVAQDSFRSSLPRSYSVEVPFPFSIVIIASITVAIIMRKNNLRRQK